MRKIATLLTASLCILSLHTLAFASEKEKKEVNIYSARKEALIKPLLDRFSDKHNVRINLVTGKGDALLTRLKAEGRNSPADLLITSDVGRLHRAKAAGVLQAVESQVLTSSIPAEYRDSENFWFGLSLRSRVLVYAPERVKQQELSTYSDLASDKWRKRICVRSSGNIYNQSLVAGMIAHDGAEATKAWLKGFVRNFARPPRGGDRDQIKAVASGQCDIALVNTYYLGAMLTSQNITEANAAKRVKLFWPDQEHRGAHMNVSGLALTKASQNQDLAIALAEFLVSQESQAWYANVNNEYPVLKNVEPSSTLVNWGEFKADSLPVEKLGLLNTEAVKAMDQAGWK